MKTVIIWAVIIGALAALELWFGVDETGEAVALALLIWGCMAIPVGLLFGQFCKFGGLDALTEELEDRARHDHRGP